MKRPIDKYFFVIFVAVWGILTVANTAKPRAEFSENENRYLSSFPKFTIERFIDGDFMKDVDSYFNDQFPLRDRWISAQSIAEYALGKRESNGVYVGKDMLFGKLDEPSNSVVDDNVTSINEFCGERALNGYVMLVPSASQVVKDRLPAFAAPWDQMELIGNVYGRLNGVTPVDIRDELVQNAGSYIYYRTDHHWTTAGAYIGYSGFCTAAGLTAEPYKAQTVSEAFNGTLYSSSGVRFVKSDSIEAFSTPYDAGCTVSEGGETVENESVYFEEYLGQKDKYAYFLGTNKAVVTLHGSAGTGKKLLMFKDSYAHCAAPMLLSNYDEITLVDLRYINTAIDDIVDVASFDDVLFLYSVDTFSHQNVIKKLTL